MGGRHRRLHLAPALALTETQQAEVLELDPSFEADVTQFTESVLMLHGQFVQNLTDPNGSDEVIRASLEALIVARTRLEQRTTEHVLRIRPLLSVDQQQRLVGLSQRGCRWRGGRNP
jgi:type II secretory pathway component PulM